MTDIESLREIASQAQWMNSRDEYENALLTLADALPGILDRLEAAEAERDEYERRWEEDARPAFVALAATEAKVARVEAVADQWVKDRAEYPLDDYRASIAFVAVKACERELRAALRG